MDKKPINVIWRSYHEPEIIARGYWDQGLLEDIFKQGDFRHHTDFSWFNDYREKEGAIVIINGRTHTEDAEKINKDLAKLAWVLFIDTGDEEAVFPWRDIKHPLMKVWMMLPRMNQHDDTAYKLINGYRPTTREVLKKYSTSTEKVYDVMFAGQVNHARREQCVEAVRALNQDTYKCLVATSDGFGKEVIPYDTYLYNMTESKIVLCPSGIESPDNFRLYEALEAGCIPIVDAFATNNQSFGFWQYLLGNDIPFPILNYWDALPKVLPGILANSQELSNKIFAWWQLKKRDIRFRLLDDVKELSR